MKPPSSQNNKYKFNDIVNMKPITINVFDYVPDKTRLFLDKDFKVKLIDKAMKEATRGEKRFRKGRRELSKLLGVSDSVIYDWKIKGKKPTLDILLKLGEITGISREEIIENAYGITAYLYPGRFYVKDWKTGFTDEFTEWLGLVEGDGHISKYAIGFCNNNLDLIFFFSDFAERNFNFSRERMEVILRASADKGDVKEVVKKLKLYGFKRINFENEKKRRFIRRKTNVSIRISSRVLVEFISNILSNLTELLEKSPNSVKAGYIRGFAAAEGSISVCRGQRAVAFYQKDKKDLLLIEKLLKCMNFKNIRFVKAYINQMTITTRKEIERYRDLVGFGHHKEKNIKLNKILSGYKMYQIPYKETYQKIREILQQQKSGTCRNISDLLNIKERYMNRILNDMIGKGMLKVDKSNKTYIYSLN